MAQPSTSSSAPKVSHNGHATASTTAENARHLHERANKDSDVITAQYEAKFKPLPFDPSLLPSGKRSLSYIGLQAFFLGFVLAACLLSAIWLIVHNRPIWRLPSFFACLSVFHFLEYWTTAHFNVPAARSSSFLLFSNGTAYNLAHTLAALEIILSNWLPRYQSFGIGYLTMSVGLGMVVMGQLVRSTAMAHAGTNFNHSLQKVRREGHELVTTGVYHWLRHPSYFGFFWWALGTQVLVGNKICLLGYIFALWKFFNGRIKAEEKMLISFFGVKYETYRKQTRTGIPFIR